MADKNHNPVLILVIHPMDEGGVLGIKLGTRCANIEFPIQLQLLKEELARSMAPLDEGGSKPAVGSTTIHQPADHFNCSKSYLALEMLSIPTYRISPCCTARKVRHLRKI